MVENEAFRQLQGFVRDGLIWGARRVASRRSSRPAAPSIETEEEVPTRRALLDEAFDDAEAAIKGTVPAKYQARVLAKVRSVVKAAVDRAGTADKAEKEARRDLLQELDLLRILASLGTTVAVFSHEIGGSVNDARGAISDIADTLQELGSGSQGSEELEQASNAIDRLDQIGEYIASYVSRARRRDRDMQPLHDVLREFGSAFDRLLNRRQIQMTFEVAPAELRTIRMSRAELEAILFNLLTNAIKAMDLRDILSGESGSWHPGMAPIWSSDFRTPASEYRSEMRTRSLSPSSPLRRPINRNLASAPAWVSRLCATSLRAMEARSAWGSQTRASLHRSTFACRQQSQREIGDNE